MRRVVESGWVVPSGVWREWVLVERVKEGRLYRRTEYVITVALGSDLRDGHGPLSYTSLPSPPMHPTPSPCVRPIPVPLRVWTTPPPPLCPSHPRSPRVWTTSSFQGYVPYGGATRWCRPYIDLLSLCTLLAGRGGETGGASCPVSPALVFVPFQSSRETTSSPPD